MALQSSHVLVHVIKIVPCKNNVTQSNIPLFSLIFSSVDIQTRPTFVKEELTEADLDKMVNVLFVGVFLMKGTCYISCGGLCIK